MEWLEARALDVELCDRLGLASRGSGSGEVLIYPFRREGVIVARKHRPFEQKEGQPRFWWNKGEPHIAYNEDCLRDDSLLHLPVVIVEGQDDCIAVLQSGHLRCISVPDGAPENPIQDVENSKKYEWIDAIYELLKHDRVKEIILAVDGDSAGAALLHDLSVKLGKPRCKFIVFPKAKDPDRRGRDRLKDMNEVLEDYGEVGVRTVLARAAFIKIAGVYKMSELPPMPDSTIYEVGFEALGEHLKIRLGDVSVWTGVPSHGKTTMLNDIICRIIQRYGITTGWASFEQDPQRDHKRALRSWFNEDYEPKLTQQQRREADAWIDQHFRFMVPDEDEDPTLEWVLRMMEAAVIQHGCVIIVIDPWNEAVHIRDAGETETDYTNRVLREMSRFAKHFQVHVAIVAHPTKMRRNDDGSYPIPSAYDISGSAAWYNKPCQVVIVHRLSELESIVKVQKVRFQELLGTPGITKFHYSKQTRRFIEVERDLPDEEPRSRRKR